MDAVTHNIEAAQRNQERFESYLLTLTFTLLALAVQTSKFGLAFPADVVELVGWGSLLLSGLTGLSRAEWQPQLFGAQSRRVAADTQAKELQKAALRGSTTVHVLEEKRDVSLSEPLERAEITTKYMDNVVSKMERRAKWKYHAQRITFVVGLIALMVARGWQPISAVYQHVLG